MHESQNKQSGGTKEIFLEELLFIRSLVHPFDLTTTGFDSNVIEKVKLWKRNQPTCEEMNELLVNFFSWYEKKTDRIQRHGCVAECLGFLKKIKELCRQQRMVLIANASGRTVFFDDQKPINVSIEAIETLVEKVKEIRRAVHPYDFSETKLDKLRKRVELWKHIQPTYEVVKDFCKDFSVWQAGKARISVGSESHRLCTSFTADINKILELQAVVNFDAMTAALEKEEREKKEKKNEFAVGLAFEHQHFKNLFASDESAAERAKAACFDVVVTNQQMAALLACKKDIEKSLDGRLLSDDQGVAYLDTLSILKKREQEAMSVLTTLMESVETKLSQKQKTPVLKAQKEAAVELMKFLNTVGLLKPESAPGLESKSKSEETPDPLEHQLVANLKNLNAAIEDAHRVKMLEDAASVASIVTRMQFKFNYACGSRVVEINSSFESFIKETRKIFLLQSRIRALSKTITILKSEFDESQLVEKRTLLLKLKQEFASKLKNNLKVVKSLRSEIFGQCTDMQNSLTGNFTPELVQKDEPYPPYMADAIGELKGLVQHCVTLLVRLALSAVDEKENMQQLDALRVECASFQQGLEEMLFVATHAESVLPKRPVNVAKPKWQQAREQQAGKELVRWLKSLKVWLTTLAEPLMPAPPLTAARESLGGKGGELAGAGLFKRDGSLNSVGSNSSAAAISEGDIEGCEAC